MNAGDRPFDAATADVTAAPLNGEASPPAFQIARPVQRSCPLVFASPHSGRIYPPEMMRAAALDAAAIRKSEDAFVDDLIGAAPTFGIPLLSARFARVYIDVNREPYELDQTMFEDKLPAYASIRTARVAAGLGSIARVVAEGQEIYRGKLMFSDARQRIDTVHRPYHQALQGLITEAKGEAGMAVLVDWHSMPSAAAGGDPRHGPPDIILGDRFGASCAPGITTFVERTLEARNYRVVRNAPYAGGYTTEFYGRPAKGVHALQVEINRALYLDEQTLRPNAGFERLSADLSDLCKTLSEWNWQAFM